MIFLFLIAGLVAGTSVPIQTSINAGLGRTVRSPFLAAFISFLMGLLTLLILVLAIDHHLSFSLKTFYASPWWIWVGGGALGVCYLTSNILLLPRLGAALTVVATLCGQMIMAIGIDQFGWFNVPIHDLSLPRLIGVVCLIAGIMIMNKY